MIDAHAQRYIGPKEPEGFMIDGWTHDSKRCCERDHDGDGNCHIHSSPGVFRNPAFNVSQYKTLDPRFLQAMDEIGVYGNEKYAEKSFHAQRANGTLKRMERTKSGEIARHAKVHFYEYLSDMPHDHFNTLRHQLAAAAFNAMMEYVYAVEADGEVI